MVKKLVVALAILLGCSAWTVGQDPPAYQASRVNNRFLRVAIVRPSLWDVIFFSNVLGYRQNMRSSMGNIEEAMRDRGLEVHHYDTGFFTQTYQGSTNAARDLWENMGSQYAVTIILQPNLQTTANFSRYVCADSTNTNVIVLGGSSLNGGWADTTARGFVDSKGVYEAGSTINQAFCYRPQTSDTMWAFRIATGRRICVLPSGILKVVRYLVPKTRTGTTFVQDVDSTNSFMPGIIRAGNGMPPGTATGDPNDTLAAIEQYLGPMWRVEFTNSLFDVVKAQGAIDPSLLYTNSLDSASCPRSVSWIKFPDGEFSQRAYPNLLWALICRFTQAKPIRYAIDADDIVDKFVNNLGAPERWTNAQGRAWLVDSLRKYNAFCGTGMNPSHGASYLRGQNPTYESAWSGEPHSYLRGMPWVHHSHDSTSGDIGSNLVGGFGGYANGNGASYTTPAWTVDINGAVTNDQIYTHRFATKNVGFAGGGAKYRDGALNYFGPGNSFSIARRLQWSDSLRRVVCPECPEPPYLNFPANQILTVGSRVRNAAFLTSGNDGTNFRYKFSAPVPGTTLPTCPIDSEWVGFAAGLGLPQDGSQYLYLRFGLLNMRRDYWQWDRDSVAALMPFLRGGDRYSVTAQGYQVNAIAIGTFQSGSPDFATAVTTGLQKANLLLGLKSPLALSDQSDPMIGETFASDYQGVYTFNPSVAHDQGYRAAMRTTYIHPLNSNPVGYEADALVHSVLNQLRLMDSIAGRPASKCSWPWEVYEP